MNSSQDFTKNKSLEFKPLREIDPRTLPEPLTWHVLVQPYVPEDKTTGGYHLTEEDSRDYKKSHSLGKILKMGPLCFDATQFHGTRPFEVGDIVLFARHSCMWLNWDGEDLAFMADDRMLMKVDPSLLHSFDAFQNHYEEHEG